eukprot:CAMPEP_0182854588 /NCGR_PEP_ID=MMETSP0034_2-20130328/1347_1 /TAXON_ID=156128 /ORGANISM="Nephroselmis pyriformis, Strain CCMP717" /LENGTH=410 /DNA_ID=CAMNT_0024985447 /DNA_START=71 /DNA_END=1299 /DNA_ORIENTATION=-
MGRRRGLEVALGLLVFGAAAQARGAAEEEAASFGDDEVGGGGSGGPGYPRTAHRLWPGGLDCSAPAAGGPSATLDALGGAGLEQASSPVHVLYSVDYKLYTQALASMTSAMANAERPEILRIHIVLPSGESPGAFCSEAASYAAWRPEIFCNPVEREMRRSKKIHRSDLMVSANWARNYADRIMLPLGVRRMVYLDADTIVQGSIATLFNFELPEGRFVGLGDWCQLTQKRWWEWDHPFMKEGSHGLKQGDCDTNAGVVLFRDLEAYRSAGVAASIEEMQRVHNERPLFKFGFHQPLFVLAVYKHMGRFPYKWNTPDLGFRDGTKPKLRINIASGAILHFNGQYKPWVFGGMHKALWEPYVLPSSLDGIRRKARRNVEGDNKQLMGLFFAEARQRGSAAAVYHRQRRMRG